MRENSRLDTNPSQVEEYDSEKVVPLRKPVKCPGCDSKSSRAYYPFCSKRCSDVDLGRWFNGTYTFNQDETSEF